MAQQDKWTEEKNDNENKHHLTRQAPSIWICHSYEHLHVISIINKIIYCFGLGSDVVWKSRSHMSESIIQLFHINLIMAVVWRGGGAEGIFSFLTRLDVDRWPNALYVDVGSLLIVCVACSLSVCDSAESCDTMQFFAFFICLWRFLVVLQSMQLKQIILSTV